VYVLCLPALSGCGVTADGPLPTTRAGTPADISVVEPRRIDPAKVGGEVVFLSGTSPLEATITRRLIARFEKLHPNIAVRFTAINRDYATVVLTRFAGGEPPDVLVIDGKFFHDWAAKGLLLPLDGYLQGQDVDIARFRPALLDAVRRPDGRTYAVPTNFSTVALFTNDEMLRAAGVAPPTTWAELEHAAERLSHGSGATRQFGLCIVPTWERMLLFALQQGGGLTDRGGTRMLATSPETTRAVQWVRSMLEGGTATSPELVGAQWCGDAFGRGRVAMALEGSWMLPPLKRQYPDLAWSTHPLPVGDRPATLAYSGNLGISRTSKNPDAAWMLVDFLASPVAQRELAKVGLAVPSLTGVEFPTQLQSFADGLDHATVWSLPPGFFNTVLITADNEMSAVLEGKQSIEGMLREVDQIGGAVLRGGAAG
jgi:multiple sugar transport system substrate-binding protein